MSDTIASGCAFYEWLMTQRSRQDGTGQLAREVAKLTAAEVPTVGGYNIWMQFLRERGAGEGWRQLARAAFDEFYEVMGV